MFRNYNNYELRGRRRKVRRFSLYDIISISTYLILTAFITYKGFLDSRSKSTRIWLMMYSFGTPLFIYLANYISLRNIRVYLIWIAISLYHMLLYAKLIDTESLNLERGHAAGGLRFTIIYLLLWQVLRLVYYRITKMELVAPAKGSQYDFFDDRRINILDYIAFAIYMGVFILLSISGLQ